MYTCICTSFLHVNQYMYQQVKQTEIYIIKSKCTYVFVFNWSMMQEQTSNGKKNCDLIYMYHQYIASML